MRFFSVQHWCLYVMLLLSLLAPSVAQAQTGEPPPALTVTIRDSADQGVAGALVRVTDRAGGREFARATTDASGQATVETLPTGDVRIQVEGQWNGVALTQTGEDADGVLLLGGDPPLTLDLRVEPDGQVIPDPATMIAPDLDGPLVPIPTAELPRPTGAGLPAQPAWSEPTTPAPSVRAGTAGAVAPVTAAPNTTRFSAPERSDTTTLWLISACIVIGATLLIAALRWGRAV